MKHGAQRLRVVLRRRSGVVGGPPFLGVISLRSPYNESCCGYPYTIQTIIESLALENLELRLAFIRQRWGARVEPQRSVGNTAYFDRNRILVGHIMRQRDDLVQR